jgi:hypothetical protein
MRKGKFKMKAKSNTGQFKMSQRIASTNRHLQRAFETLFKERDTLNPSERRVAVQDAMERTAKLMQIVGEIDAYGREN